MKILVIMSALSALLLAGCATPQAGEFPSLAKRPQERAGDRADAPTITTAISAPADAVLQAQLRDLSSQIGAGQAAFAKTLPQARAAMAAARGAAPASEAWVQAAMLLAALELDRGPSQTALSELDQVLVNRSMAPVGSAENGGMAEIDAAWMRANAVVAEQTRVIESLKMQLLPA